MWMAWSMKFYLTTTLRLQCEYSSYTYCYTCCYCCTFCCTCCYTYCYTCCNSTGIVAVSIYLLLYLLQQHWYTSSQYTATALVYLLLYLLQEHWYTKCYTCRYSSQVRGVLTAILVSTGASRAWLARRHVAVRRRCRREEVRLVY